MMKRNFWAVGSVAGVALFLASGLSDVAARQPGFEEDIKPILQLRCVECHQPGGQGYEASGLDLTSYEGLMKGTKYGPVVKPRQPAESTLDAVISWRVNPEVRMPYHRGKLSWCEIREIRTWIAQGAQNN